MATKPESGESAVTAKVPDRRVQRTRRALFSAFTELVQERRYDEIRVQDLLRRADVARSTFYQHFSGKDDLLQQSLEAPFGPLADSVSEAADVHRVQAMVEHFWLNRHLARGMLGGPSTPQVTDVLARLIEQRLASRAGNQGRTSSKLPLPLIAAQIAGAQLGLIHAWLRHRGNAQPHQLAEAIVTTSQSMAATLL